MSLQLTPEQEQRIQAVVNAGAYSSTEEALNAAVVAIETAAVVGFDGTKDDLEILLIQGMASPELSEDQFWSGVESETFALLANRKQEPRA